MALKALHTVTLEALANQDEAGAERKLGLWLAANGPNPAVLHWRALLLRGLDRHGEAIVLLRDALARVPGDAELVRNLAQVSLEAGLPSDDLFEQALQLDPASVPTRRGLVSAYFAAGKGAQGLALLEAALAANPGWHDGHAQYAQLATLTGQPQRAVDTLLAAIERFPDRLELRAQMLGLLLLAGDHARVADLAEAAIARLGDVPLLLVDRAAALDELGHGDAAAALFARAGEPADVGHATWLIRHHLRRGDAKAALAVAEPWLTRDGATQIWPYVSLIWRMLGDDHAEWLERQDGLIATAELGDQVDLAALGRSLRRIHAGSGRFIDQSVRGGTQTDGPLFSRIEPEIVAFRKVMADAMAQHAAALPAHDAFHPQLALRRDRAVRFAGSWSVRLEDQGFHTSHHHPMGWFSAVFYVAVPDTLAGDEGQLVLGAPPAELGLDLAPFQKVAPRPGRLAIFPSTMWHATFPLSAGERMTIAFDTARPTSGDIR
ncbi:putative 2OG-Fe(II) oxygenase [Novosphingobium sp.]|uniref:2OG-Fe(II) oxygenase family protein n=1 Tax=Novosphingobium sp. TaxID=1874826 RepID=UPI00286D5845|nr:putative 2OG-Fe(II) oxygenase [Novosphingobium sp.]